MTPQRRARPSELARRCAASRASDFERCWWCYRSMRPLGKHYRAARHKPNCIEVRRREKRE